MYITEITPDKFFVAILILFLLQFASNLHTVRASSAVFSEAAYAYAASLKGNEPAKIASINEELSKKGYKQDTEVSDTDVVVYIPQSEAQPIVMAFRGTDFENKGGNRNRDAIDDARIGAGTFGSSKRVNDMVLRFYKVANRYPKFMIELTGHSLGGSTADEVARKVARHPQFRGAQTIDKGAGAASISRGVTDQLQCMKMNPFRSPYCDRVFHERAEMDLVSTLGRNQRNTTTYKPQDDQSNSLFQKTFGLSAHTLGHFRDVNTAYELGGDVKGDLIQYGGGDFH